jgi:hypothetical protein
MGTCESCAYWQQSPTQKWNGYCRRYAPRPGDCTQVWPLTKSDDFCGDYSAKRTRLTAEKKEEPAFSQDQIRQIYLAYPRRDKPQTAFVAIAKAVDDVETQKAADWCEDRPLQDNIDLVYEFLLERTKMYAAFCEKTMKDKKYIPLPATWFNAKDYMVDHASGKHFMHDVPY